MLQAYPEKWLLRSVQCTALAAVKLPSFHTRYKYVYCDRDILLKAKLISSPRNAVLMGTKYRWWKSHISRRDYASINLLWCKGVLVHFGSPHYLAGKYCTLVLEEEHHFYFAGMESCYCCSSLLHYVNFHARSVRNGFNVARKHDLKTCSNVCCTWSPKPRKNKVWRVPLRLLSFSTLNSHWADQMQSVFVNNLGWRFLTAVVLSWVHLGDITFLLL